MIKWTISTKKQFLCKREH